MGNIGILCTDSLDIVGHSLFNNFRLALTNYFKQPLQPVNSVNDLQAIDILIIVDEHFAPNVPIWQNNNFIDTLNSKNIRTIIFNFERIFSSQFPWNVDHQRKAEQIKNLVQIVSDVDDTNRLNKTIINKQFLSKDTVLVEPKKEKLDKIIFLGQCNNYYPTRKNILTEFSRIFGDRLDIIISDRKLSYNDFLQKINNYKYVLNPLGTGKFINLRFYEALKLGCIPIQEIRSEMIPWYKELSSCVYFSDLTNIENHVKSAIYKPMDFYLEDYFNEINLKGVL